MSSFAAIRQRHAVHMMTDGLTYSDDVVLEVDRCKAIVLAGMSAALSTTGPADFGAFLAEVLSVEFATFDDLAQAGEQRITELFFRFVDEFRDGDAVAMLCLIGWHEAAAKPGLYTMRLDTGGSVSAAIAEHGDGEFDAPFVLAPIDCAATPSPSLADYKAARFDILMDFDKVDAEAALLHQIEIQRRMPFDGRYVVGGHAHLTSVTAAGVEQRIVRRWEEDCLGEIITPLPMDWKARQTAHEAKRVATVDLTGLSRLQRERMEKKARKGTLRAAQ